MSIAIVGGGITGLAAAHRLEQLSPDADVVLVEAGSRLGGKLLTERVTGFVIEAAPDAFLSSKPRGLGLSLELGLRERLQGPDEQRRRTYVMRQSRLYPMPEGLTGLIPSRLAPMARSKLLSPSGKLRLALDYLLPARPEDGDESLASFIRRRLGPEAYARLVEPLMAGIYAGDGEDLSLAATFPQLRELELEYGSLVRGMRASRGAPAVSSARWPAFVTLQDGMSELITALERRLIRTHVRAGTRVCHVTVGPGESSLRLSDGSALRAGSVILATPAFVSADLLEAIDAELATTLRSIPYVSTATISVAYPVAAIPRPLDGYGYIVPRLEGRPILACTWTSTKFPNRAPAGYALIRAFIGRAGQPDPLQLSDQELLAVAREELRAVLGVTAAPVLHRIYRWPGAMPQYTLGHLDRLATIDRRLSAHPGLFLAGAAYRGVGIPDCIQSGEAAAAFALSHARVER
jgi:oxygen-dependent protoporphyrinogen oxidase